MQASNRAKKILRWIAALLLCVIVIAACLMLWGAHLLESSDSLPPHVDAAIVLEGSQRGERARLAGAMQLLRDGIPSRVLVALPQESFWGEPVPPAARAFIETTYGHDLAERVDFCEVAIDVDSTLEEARAIDSCIQQHQWKTIVVVTSNYHTRRAGMVWRKVVQKQDPQVQLWVHGVDDPEFQNQWWRQRLWAKTWLMEFTKLVWNVAVGR